jgi:exonuclease III
LPFFESEDTSWTSSLLEPNLTQFSSYLDDLLQFAQNFSILHLNINSFSNASKLDLTNILDLKVFDVVLLNETKLDSSITESFFQNQHYTLIRRDKNGNGGGIMIFLRNSLKVVQTTASPDFESVYVKLIVDKKPVNIFSCYKPPGKEDGNELQFLEFLENQLFLLNPEEDTFIIGDLNMILLIDDGISL